MGNLPFSPFIKFQIPLQNETKTEFAFWWFLEGIKQVAIKSVFCNYQITLILYFPSDIFFHQKALFRAQF